MLAASFGGGGHPHARYTLGSGRALKDCAHVEVLRGASGGGQTAKKSLVGYRRRRHPWVASRGLPVASSAIVELILAHIQPAILVVGMHPYRSANKEPSCPRGFPPPRRSSECAPTTRTWPAFGVTSMPIPSSGSRRVAPPRSWLSC